MSAASPKRAPARKQTRRRALTDMRRGEIIAAALKVFAKKGFHHARAEDIANQARIAKGTLYLYFVSKEAIYEAALAHALEQLYALVAGRLEHATTAEEKLRIYIQSRLEFWSAQGEIYRMIMTVGREKKQKKHTADILRESVDQLVTIFSEGIAAGELEDRPVDQLSWSVLDMIRGMCERRVEGMQTTTVEQDTELMTAIALRYFGELQT